MKKNIRDNSYILLYFYVIAIGIVGVTGFECYCNQKQIEKAIATDDNTFINDDGNIYCYFEPGEHYIKISRNDAFFHEIQNVEGYRIESVKLNGLIHNNTTIYVNEEPVIAIATKVKDNEILFDNFGIVVEKEKIYSK